MRDISKNQNPTFNQIKSSAINHKRTLEELNMMDSFLFDAATEDAENARKIAKVIIERATGYVVKNLIVETQKELKGISLDKRGIRMDVYVREEDEAPDGNATMRVYDIEPNNYYEEDIPRRSRFYQSMLDSKLLPPNTPFKKLPEVITIWILPYDPFGDDRMLYTVKNMVVENNELVYNDGILKIFLFTKGKKGGSRKLKDLLTYMEHTVPANAVDEDLQELQKLVGTVKSKKGLGDRYMTLQEMMDYEKRDSYQEGLEQGIQQGVQGTIATCKFFKSTRVQAKDMLRQHHNLTEEQAEEYLKLYW